MSDETMYFLEQGNKNHKLWDNERDGVRNRGNAHRQLLLYSS